MTRMNKTLLSLSIVAVIGLFVAAAPVLAQSAGDDEIASVVISKAERVHLLLTDGRVFDARGPISKRDGLILFYTSRAQLASIRADRVREVRPISDDPGARGDSGGDGDDGGDGGAPGADQGAYSNEDLPAAPEPMEADPEQEPFATETLPDHPDEPAEEPVEEDAEGDAGENEAPAEGEAGEDEAPAEGEDEGEEGA